MIRQTTGMLRRRTETALPWCGGTMVTTRPRLAGRCTAWKPRTIRPPIECVTKCRRDAELAQFRGEPTRAELRQRHALRRVVEVVHDVAGGSDQLGEPGREPTADRDAVEDHDDFRGGPFYCSAHLFGGVAASFLVSAIVLRISPKPASTRPISLSATCVRQNTFRPPTLCSET